MAIAQMILCGLVDTPAKFETYVNIEDYRSGETAYEYMHFLGLALEKGVFDKKAAHERTMEMLGRTMTWKGNVDGIVAAYEAKLISKRRARSYLKMKRNWPNKALVLPKEYRSLLLRAFDAGLVSKKTAREAIFILPEDEMSVTIEFFKKGLISRKIAKQDIEDYLTECRRRPGTWDREDAELLVDAISTGLLTGSEEVLSYFNMFKRKKAYDICLDILAATAIAGIIPRDDARRHARRILPKIEEMCYGGSHDPLLGMTLLKAMDAGLLDNTSALLLFFNGMRRHAKDPEDLEYDYAEAAKCGIEKHVFKRWEELEPYIKFSGERKSEVLKAAIASGLITSMEDLLPHLYIEKRRGDWTSCADLLFDAVERNEPTIASAWAGLNQQARHYGMPLIYMATLNQLGMQGEEAASMAMQGKTLLESIRTANRQADADHAADISDHSYPVSVGLCKAQWISPIAAKHLVYHYTQRGYLPLLVSGLGVFSGVEPGYLGVLRKFVAGHGKRFVNRPLFIQQLAGFANAYAQSGLTETQYLKNLSSSHKTGEITDALGKTLIAAMGRQMGFRVAIPQSSSQTVLKDWDLANFGIMVSAKANWGENYRSYFELMFRLALKGKFEALMYPQQYSELGKTDAPAGASQLIEIIRGHNQAVVHEAKGLGVRVEGWMKPSTVMPPIVVGGQETLRGPVDILKDFKSRVNAFENWIDENAPLMARHGNAMAKAKQSLGPWASVLTVESDEDLSRFRLLSEDSLNRASRLKRLKDLMEIMRLEAPQGNVPEAIADVEIILDEILRYQSQRNADASAKKAYRIGFWDRQPGKDALLGNQAGSCTALGSNATAIFEYLLDIGTHYVVVTDPVRNIPVGYARIFLARNSNGAAIRIDSVDGLPAHNNISAIYDFLRAFASKVGIDPGQIQGRGEETAGDPIESKVGGALTENYHHYSGLTIPAITFVQETMEFHKKPKSEMEDALRSNDAVGNAA